MVGTTFLFLCLSEELLEMLFFLAHPYHSTGRGRSCSPLPPSAKPGVLAKRGELVESDDRDDAIANGDVPFGLAFAV